MPDNNLENLRQIVDFYINEAHSHNNNTSQTAYIETTILDRVATHLYNDGWMERDDKEYLNHLTTSLRQAIRQQREQEQETDNEPAANQVNTTQPCPRKMKQIKRACYQMVDARDTRHLKQRLDRLGYSHLITNINLRTKAGWKQVFHNLQNTGFSNSSSSHNQVQWQPCGIEIEFSPNNRTTTQQLRRRIQCKLETMMDNGEISRGWESERDPSCGNEVISPILYSRQQFIDEVTKVRRVIIDLDGRFSTSAGGHVHIDASNHTGLDYLKISRRYLELLSSHVEPKLMRYRLSNRHCRATTVHSMSNDEADGRSIMAVARQTQAGARTRAVNGLTGKNTIEYRQGPCILSNSFGMNELVTWVDFLQALHQHQV